MADYKEEMRRKQVLFETFWDFDFLKRSSFHDVK